MWCALSGIDFWKLTTLLVGAFATYVAYRQYSLGREKFKLDLFEKRFAVFTGARIFLSRVFREGKAELPTLFEYRAAIGESSFLYGRELVEYLESIYTHGLNLHTKMEEMQPLPVGTERSALAQEISNETRWLVDQLPKLKDRFHPYLGFESWQ